MKQNKKQLKAPIIISVGGSLIVPLTIDTEFLKNFKALIERRIKKGDRFIVICGGGRLARDYQHAGKEITKLRSVDVDWLGIHSTRLNAQLLKTVLIPRAVERVVKKPDEKVDFNKPVLVASGWKPGRSTDYVAVCLAKKFKASKLINLSNIDYVYTADPRTNPNATKIEQINWKNFRKIIPKKWDPGLSSPFDPVASREAEKLGLEVAIINGKKLEELDHYLAGEKFVGSLII